MIHTMLDIKKDYDLASPNAENLVFNSMAGLAKTQSNSYRYKKKHMINTPTTPHTPGIFSMRNFKVNNVFFSSQNVIHQERRTCSVCGFDDISSYCCCRDRFYHEACLKTQIIENLPRLKEVAFLCQYCLQFYKYKAQKIPNIDPQGKKTLIISCMLFLICALVITLVLLFKQSVHTNDFIICSIILVTTFMIGTSLMYYNYVHLWIIKWSLCISSEVIEDKSIKQIMPYLLSNRYEYVSLNEKISLQIYSHPPPQIRQSISLDEVRELE